MKAMNSKKGFTLIELLIVIAIIGVLAVAFLPSLLGAPAKGRDTSRIADLQKIQKVLINANLGGAAYPPTSCVKAGASFDPLLAAFGGKLPVDPQPTNIVTGSGCAVSEYAYIKDPNGAGGAAAGTYSFGVFAHMENIAAANAKCDKALIGSIVAPAAADAAAVPSNICYAILTQ